MSNTTLWNFESKTSAAVLSRGRSYHIRGRVLKLTELAPDEWTAQVKGSSTTYGVNISLDGDTVTSYDCECPYDWGGMCKHVVATLLRIRDRKPQPVVQPATPQPEPADERYQRAAEILAK